MADFNTVIEKTVWEMIKKYDTCIQPHYNALGDVQIVFMEAGYANMPNMHQLMKELHVRLTELLGHPPCMTHNHPTDSTVQVLIDPICGEVYYSDECCKRSTIEAYKNFCNSDRKGYRDEYRSVFLGAECLAEGLNKTPEYILQTLDWDKDPQAQIIQLLIDYHA